MIEKKDHWFRKSRFDWGDNKIYRMRPKSEEYLEELEFLTYTAGGEVSTALHPKNGKA